MVWRPLALAALAMATGPVAWAQEPAPVTQLREDIDGDGRKDVVSIDSGGSLTVHITGSKELAAWKAIASSGRVVAGTLQVGKPSATAGRHILLAVVDLGTVRGGATRREATVLEWSAGKLDELWRGEIRRSGDDSEERIELSPFGLIRYTHRPGIARCDGRDAYLYAHRFDFAGRRFRPAGQPVRLQAKKSLRAAAARPDAVASGRGRLFRDPTASSALGIASAAHLAPPHQLVDDSPRTGWVEGKGGFGRGEFLTLRSPLTASVVALRVVPGIAGERRFNRPRRLGLLVGTQSYWLDFSTDPQPRDYWVTLPRPVEARCVSLIIEQVWPPSAQNRNTGATAIAEVEVFTDLDLEPERAAEVLVQRISAGGIGEQSARHLLAELGAEAVLPPLRAAIKVVPDPARKMRLLRVAAAIPAAPDLLGEGLLHASRPADVEAFAEALRRLGAAAIPALAGVIGADAASDEQRAQAMQILAQIEDPAATQELVSLAGKGTRAARRELARALGRRPAAQLDVLLSAAAAAAAADDRGAEADLWRAIGQHVRQHRAGAEAVAPRLVDRLRQAEDYELSTRLIEAAAATRSPQAVGAVVDRLRAQREARGIRDIVLRRIATGALAPADGEVVANALRDSLGDEDPGVRLAALSALQDRDPTDASFDAALISALGDPWPDVRRGSSAALGTRCKRDTVASALQRNAETDAKSRVAITSLVGLVACRASGAAEVVLGILSDRKRPIDLRIAAARVLPDVATPKLLPRALKALRREKARALEEESSRRVAQSIALGVGEAFREPEAVRELVSIARDPAFPGLQAAALEGLSSHCPAQLNKLLAELGATAQERIVALAIQRARARCNIR